MARAPLKLFWYRKVRNFGDAISQRIAEFVSGRPVVWASRSEAELFGLGSLMEMVAQGHRTPREDGTKPWVWGTGCMTRRVPPFLDNVRIALLRGPITAEILGLDAGAFGDPGLLIADVLTKRPECDGRIGIVPHLSKIADPAWTDLVAEDRRLRLIDVTQPDPLGAVRQIASCAHVISSSLHGLITADAFGIPNTWLDPAHNHAAPQLKFRDYARSVGRRFFDPLDRRDILAHIDRGLPDDIPYMDGIEASKLCLLNSFPAELKAGTTLKGAA
ncbi:MAG: polysaccharide pyruvyl transferase family protein [Rhodobacter sp.]|nr:polysaccharide pyruvyl transferase family protein [Rhodobacter sp.]